MMTSGLETDDLEISEEEEEITTQEVLQKLENAWLNERFAPEILPPQQDLLDLMMAQVEHMKENLEPLNKNDLRYVVHKMDLDRIRYVIASYLRVRLMKIEEYSQHIIIEESKRPIDEKRLMPAEQKFAEAYFGSISGHFNHLVLQHMPQMLDDAERQIIKPDLLSHVFLKANDSIASVTVTADDEQVDIAAGSQHIMPYKLAADLLKSVNTSKEVAATVQSILYSTSGLRYSLLKILKLYSVLISRLFISLKQKIYTLAI